MPKNDVKRQKTLLILDQTSGTFQRLIAKEMMLAECGLLCETRFPILLFVDLSDNEILHFNISLATDLWPNVGDLSLYGNNLMGFEDLRAIPVHNPQGKFRNIDPKSVTFLTLHNIFSTLKNTHQNCNLH